MNVSELIGLLQQCDPGAEVEIWGAHSDDAVTSPGVFVDDSGSVLVGIGPWGCQISGPAPTRHTNALGPLPINENSLDLLDCALSNARERLQHFDRVMSELTAARAIAEGWKRRFEEVQRLAVALPEQLRDLADAIKPDPREDEDYERD